MRCSQYKGLIIALRSKYHLKISGVLSFKPGAVGWEARSLPLCYGVRCNIIICDGAPKAWYQYFPLQVLPTAFLTSTGTLQSPTTWLKNQMMSKEWSTRTLATQCLEPGVLIGQRLEHNCRVHVHRPWVRIPSGRGLGYFLFYLSPAPNIVSLNRSLETQHDSIFHKRLCSLGRTHAQQA